MALGHLTSSTINDIDALDDDYAPKLKRWFEPSLRQMGRRHWNCLGAIADLSRDASNPEFGFDYRYELPNDCMLVRKVNGYLVHSQTAGTGYGFDFGDSEYQESAFQIFGRFIHTDAEECKIEYTQYVTNTSELDGMFLAAYACLIASNACASILNSGSQQTKFALYRMYKDELLPEALMADGNERSIGPADITHNSRFQKARRVGTYNRIPYGS